MARSIAAKCPYRYTPTKPQPALICSTPRRAEEWRVALKPPNIAASLSPSEEPLVLSALHFLFTSLQSFNTTHTLARFFIATTVNAIPTLHPSSR
jgi:hypothetical protein